MFNHPGDQRISHRRRQGFFAATLRLRVALLALAMAPAIASAETFDWRSASGLNFLSPVRDQGPAGACLK